MARLTMMIVKNIPGKLLSGFISIFSDTKILRQLKGDKGFSIKTDCKFFDEVFTLSNNPKSKSILNHHPPISWTEFWDKC